ncbi:MAG: DUF362 domain-containing protein [Sphingobacterium sp.]|nr:DUF362 domain-containing protein [Sphingobacterium sp.]
MLKDAGFTAERYPGIALEGLQTMDEAAAEGKTEDNSKWLKADGTHVSVPNFDQEVFYWADVEGPKDLPYLNQHVFNGKHSYFGKLLTEKLTKIVNLPVFKNTGNAISMATKNIGYGAVCNTNRLHAPLFLDVCVEVPAFWPVRDKMVLNVTDGLRSQYDGGPDKNAKFAYIDNRLYFASDPFALDMVCHNRIVAKRKEMGVAVNENPRFTEYLRYAETAGAGDRRPGQDRACPGLTGRGGSGGREGSPFYRRSPRSSSARSRRRPAAACSRSPRRQAVPGTPAIPAAAFAPGWATAGALRTFTGQDLFNQIDGGAELFLEFGFVQPCASRPTPRDKSELTLNAYEMESAAAALGVYLMKMGRETPFPEIAARNSGEEAQMTIVKGRYFVQVDNLGDVPASRAEAAALANAFLAGVADESAPTPLDVAAGRGQGARLRAPHPRALRTPALLHLRRRGHPVARRQSLRRAGRATGCPMEPRSTRLIVPYPDSAASAAALAHLKANLDTYIKVTADRPDGFDFVDYRSMKGSVARSGAVLHIRFNVGD